LNQPLYSPDSKSEREEVENLGGEIESDPAEKIFRELEKKWK
jgi:hypothetical protein